MPIPRCCGGGWRSEGINPAGAVASGVGTDHDRRIGGIGGARHARSGRRRGPRPSSHAQSHRPQSRPSLCRHACRRALFRHDRTRELERNLARGRGSVAQGGDRRALALPSHRAGVGCESARSTAGAPPDRSLAREDLFGHEAGTVVLYYARTREYGWQVAHRPAPVARCRDPGPLALHGGASREYQATEEEAGA